MNKKSCENNTIFCPRLYKAGVVRVAHLVDENGCIMDYNGFNNEYHTNCNILLYYKVVKAIPKPWLVEIEKYVQTNQAHICIKFESLF